MEYKRITLFAGHYGSGKTNVAVNFALALKREFDRVAVADLDIVNPYFRTKDCEGMLESKGIHLISSQYANSNVDVPSLPAEAYAVLDDKSIHAVIDVGGDDRGALALGRYAPEILSENDYEMLFVINKYRPLTRESKSTIEVMREIESAGGIKFTGIINNSNLGDDTTAQNVIDSFGYANEISKITALPIIMSTVKEDIYASVAEDIPGAVPIRLFVKQSWSK